MAVGIDIRAPPIDGPRRSPARTIAIPRDAIEVLLTRSLEPDHDWLGVGDGGEFVE
jgi:hypothetical protein